MDGADPQPETQAAILAAIPGTRLLCFGDVMLDRFLHGRVERVSPEAPIPVLAIEGEAEMPGGAGNVARNAAALGAGVELIGLRGEDEAGERLARLAGPGSQLLIEAQRRTTVKTRYLSGGHQLLRADSESLAPPKPETVSRLLARFDAALPRADAVVLSDYGKGALSGALAAEAVGRAKAAGRLVAVDPRGPDWSRYRGADLITPNRRELGEASGAKLVGLESIEAAARALLKAHGLGAVLVTLSEQGMLVVEAGRSTHVPAAAREVFDVSGAGDTVIAVAAAAMAAGASLSDAARLANLAAGLVVAKLATAVARPREILAALGAVGAEGKCMPLEEAVEQIRRWRLGGLRIGFTNGCFDLLHPGHASLLAFARAACDRLVVGLNDDASVRRLKGAGRPVQPMASRAAVLGALAAVDLVVPFAEDTPLALIQAIRPDLLVKGADYREDEVVGAELVRGYGGEVRLAPLSPGHSTTATIARLGAAAPA
ncbi:MAG: bifunctional heptose 7-phosphate kinase/heptose 1-phosphate adenyltransferase [Geminicoccaceae bacterium]|nr:bifunctional heptose 7-phosphate kinase/heptose 1-phosphate adenyltransferase [Geminicoccaceae bacterium]